MANKPLSENARTVLEFLKENAGKDVTYVQIAEETGLAPRTVNGIITSALKRRGLAERIPGKEEGKKFIVLTDAGLSYDPTADDAEEKE
jgi:DNA-binding MarR family transcriptional regulator